jgi:hypothetical protein
VKTVLVVDNDLGFAFWLGHALDEAGHYALPAFSAAGASRLLTELGLLPDLIIINAALPSASSFVTDLRLSNPGLKVIAILDDPAALPPAFLQANLVEHKPASIDESAKRDWVETVRVIVSTQATSS